MDFFLVHYNLHKVYLTFLWPDNMGYQCWSNDLTSRTMFRGSLRLQQLFWNLLYRRERHVLVSNGLFWGCGARLEDYPQLSSVGAQKVSVWCVGETICVVPTISFNCGVQELGWELDPIAQSLLTGDCLSLPEQSLTTEFGLLLLSCYIVSFLYWGNLKHVWDCLNI